MELSYSGAGFQELPLVRKGNGERQRLISKGLPISAAIPQELMDFTAEHITLTPGTTVLLTTDGLTEQVVGETQYGSRLEDVFHAHGHLSPEVVVRRINEDFCQFNNGSQQGDDDITFLVLQAD